MKPYCVIVVKYVLPAIRVLIMYELMEKHGFRKIDVAENMSLSPAAVTQYSKGVRGSHFIKKLSESKEIMKKISKIAESIADDEVSTEVIIDNMCEVCGLIRNDKLLCDLHSDEFSKSELDECRICLNDETQFIRNIEIEY